MLVNGERRGGTRCAASGGQGSPQSETAMMDNSALYAEQCGVKVFLPEYRIAPSANCETIMQDCYEMLRYLFEHAKELQVDPQRVIL